MQQMSLVNTATILALLFTNSVLAESQGFVKSTAIWPHTNIPVCWECDGHDEMKRWIREAVEESWEANSIINFTGWGRCPHKVVNIVEDDPPKQSFMVNGQQPTERKNSHVVVTADVYFAGIRIGIEPTLKNDYPAYTKGLGSELKGERNSMMYDSDNPEWFTRAAAVHEFGHALGMAHEHHRDDTPESCEEEKIGSYGDVLVGPYDANSVMNYCAPTSSVLSDGDIVTINWMYPEKLEKPIAYTPVASGKNVTLFWMESDPYQNETVYYNVYLDEQYPPTTLVAQAVADTFTTVEDLEYNRRYFCKIVAVRSATYGSSAQSIPGLSFSTIGDYMAGGFPSIRHSLWGFTIQPDNDSNDWDFIYQDGYTIANVENPFLSNIQTPTMIEGDTFQFEVKPDITPIVSLLLLD